MIAILVVPAATKQWSDRAGELALKKDLVSQINTTVTEAVTVTDCTVRIQTCFPEARALEDPNLGQNAGPEVDAADVRALFETGTDWKAGEALITSTLDAYFAGSVRSAWTQHAEAVSAFRRLSTLECGDAREKDTDYLRRYLPETEENVWTLLRTGIGPNCTLPSLEFEQGYSALAQALLAQTTRITRAVIDADADGYSNGLGDFVRDLWPL